QRITVGWRALHELRADDLALSAAVLHHDPLADALGQPFGNGARHDVLVAARHERDDEADWLDGIRLRRRVGGGARDDHNPESQHLSSLDFDVAHLLRALHARAHQEREVGPGRYV